MAGPDNRRGARRARPSRPLFELGLVLACVVGCATPVSRAVVTRPGGAAATRGAPRTLLVLPTTCRALELGASTCVPATYFENGAAEAGVRVPKTFAKIIDPLLRLKLELAGFTLADAEVMFLETSERAERTDASGDLSPAPAPASEGEPPTLAALPPGERQEVAAALGLEGIASAELVVRRASPGRVAFQLAVHLRAFAGDWPGMSVRCEEIYESVAQTSTVVANCVGDGVLAAVAPDALLARLP